MKKLQFNKIQKNIFSIVITLVFILLAIACSENIFDDVANSERVIGDVEYRKIYIRNEGATWSNVVAWIQRFSRAFGDLIFITIQDWLTSPVFSF